MKCKALHNKLIFYLEGDLPEKEAEQVQDHLSECSDCARFASEMQKTLGILETEKAPEVNPFFFTRLKAKMKAQNESFEPKAGHPFLIRVLQPALFTLLLLAGIYSGIKIGQKAEDRFYVTTSPDVQVIPYLNEMEAEPIEAFLME
ncbi:MAG: anti-sigma factor family protein [Tangfeifania sp.]